MKRAGIFLAAAFCTVLMSASTFGQQLLVEDFNYNAGTNLTANGWTAHSGGGTNPITVVSPGLTFTGYPSSGVGNAASMTTSGEDDNRTFTSQTSGSVYAAFLVNVSAASTNVDGDYFFHLGPNPIGSTFRARVFAKRDASNNLAFGVSKAGSAAASTSFTGFTFSLNTTVLIVVKYTIVAGATNDTVTLFINPTLGGVEPSPTLTAPDTSATDSNIGAVALRQGTAAQAPTERVDGIRVGTTWESVTNGPIFRSIASGNWNATSTWEQSFDGTTFSAALSTPTSASNTITVRSPHTVTVTANVDADQLTVDSGGQVSVSSGVTFTIADGTGTDLTANGTLTTASNFQNNGQTTINGVLQINTGGFVSGNAPTYGATSQLKYNTGGTYGRSLEWNANGGVQPGYPNIVQLSNNTTLNLGANGGTATPRQTAGSLFIDVGSSLEMAGANPMTAPLTVLGTSFINGNLNLSSSIGGDYKAGGDWIRGGTYNPNGRAVFFIGSTAQTVSVLSGGSETFNYLIVDKPSADLIINNSAPANDILVNATAGDVLQILNAGGIDLNGRSLVMQNNGGNIRVSGGVRNVTGAFGSNFEFTGSKTVTSTSGGTLVFGTGVAVRLNNSVNFGASLTTVNGNLFLQSGGSVNTNPPTYGTNSTLVYDCSCVYGRSAEWSATSGPGYPNNVQANFGTDVNIGSATPNVARQTAGSLNAKNGGRFLMDHPSLPMTMPLSVRGDVIIESGGSLNLSTSPGGDLRVGGNFTDDGTFVNNGRTTRFDGTAPQVIGGSGGINFFGFEIATGSTVSATANFNVMGQWTNDGAYNGGGFTVNFNGAAAQTIGGASASNFSSLINNNTGGGLSLTQNQTVNNVLTLNTGDLTTGASVLTQFGSTAPTDFDVVGNVRREDLGTTTRQFGNPNVQVTFPNGTPPSEMTINLVKMKPTGPGIGFPTAVNRTYNITPTGGGGYTARLRLRYKDTELTGNPPLGAEEPVLDLWRFDGTKWQRVPRTPLVDNSATENWVQSPNVTQFSPWTISANPLAPTAAILREFRATHFDGQGTVIEWQTEREVDNLGFHLYREDGNGRRTLVTPSLVAGSALTAGPGTVMGAGNAYTWVDRAGTSSSRYWLEDVDTDGTATSNGPFLPASAKASGNWQRAQMRPQSLLLSQLGANAKASQSTQVQSSARAAAAGTLSVGDADSESAIEKQRALAGGHAVKLHVRRAGWYRVTRAQLEAAGLNASTDPARLQLFTNGVEQAIRVDASAWAQSGGALEFYGEGLDTVSTDTRVYWLVEGATQGRRATSAPAQSLTTPRGARGVVAKRPGLIVPPPPAAAQSFADTVELRERNIYYSSLLNGETGNFFGRVVGTTPVTQTLAVSAPESSESDNSTRLEVALQGVTTNAHAVTVFLNDEEVGALDFAGRTHKAATFNLLPGQLRAGANHVRLVANGAGDISLTDYVRVTYRRLYRAEDDALRFNADANRQIRVAGFSTPQVRVVDVTDPANVVELATTAGDAEIDGSFSVTVQTAGNSTRTLMAFADTRVSPVEAAISNAPSDWHASREADFVVVTHGAFRQAVAPLVERRTEEGLATEVVDVEDLYDEFSYGAHSPQAVRDFLAWTAQNWGRAPRYVLFVGDGSYDPRDHLARGSFDLVPTKLVDTEHMETASDNWYADFDDDGLSEMAVGRLPVRTVEEAALVVSKIVGYEPDASQQSALMVADRAGSDGYSFESATDGVQALLPSNFSVLRVDRGAQSAEAVRGQIVGGINTGPMLVNWMGHGSINVWTGEGLLRGEDAAALQNGSRLPVFVMMTCLNGYYQDPSLESLSESLLKATQGGAVAVWTSTGMTEPDGQVAMNGELYRALFGGGDTTSPLRLGEAMQRARTATTDRDVLRTWVLIGDPTTRVR